MLRAAATVLVLLTARLNVALAMWFRAPEVASRYDWMHIARDPVTPSQRK
jgi:hypothetical protein